MKYSNTIHEFIKYLHTVGYGNEVKKQLQCLINHFLKHCNKSVSKLNAKDVERFIEHLKSTKSKKTHNNLSNTFINSYIHTLQRFSKYLLHTKKQHLIITTTLLKVVHKEKTITQVNDIQQLFERCKNDKYGSRDKVILAIYYCCGLRRNEGIHLQLKDIDLRNNTLFVSKGKFGKQRYVPFNDFTQQIFKQYIQKHRKRFVKRNNKNNYVLISRLGYSLKEKAISNRLKKLCNEVNIKQNVSLHTLRHSIATHLLQNDMNIYQVSQFLGHSSLEATQIYTHINEDSKQVYQISQ